MTHHHSLHISSSTHESDEDTKLQRSVSLPLTYSTESALATSGQHHRKTDKQNESVDHDNLSDVNSILSKKRRRWLIAYRIIYIVLIYFVIPTGLYYALKPHLPAVWALVISSSPSIVSFIFQAVFMRRIDTFAIAAICGFIISITLALANRDPKLMLLRESFITAFVGLICALTLIPLRIKTWENKPILYYLGRDLIPLHPVYFNDPDKQPQPRLLFYWENSYTCRLHLRLLTGIDIILLELEFGLKLFYILTFELDMVVILSNLTLTAVTGLVCVITICYIVWIRKRLKRKEPILLSRTGALIK